MTALPERGSAARRGLSPGTFAQLTKFRISVMSTLTAIAGHVAFVRGFDWSVLYASAGTLLLAMGACVINEIEERNIDAKMERTRKRPLPSGTISVHLAVAVATALSGAGFSVLYLGGSLLAALLGLLALLWYTCVYTPLKRVTPFAAVPGSLIGALPPAIGWASAGGDILDPAILSLCFVFFVWQVPHFWLLVLLHADDYERAGLPVLRNAVSERGLSRMTFTWISATAASCALLPLFRGLLTLPATVLLFAAAGWLVVKEFPLAVPAALPPYRRAFLDINIFALALVASVVIDPFLAR